MQIRPYIPEQDADAAYGLWQATLNSQWPLTRTQFTLVVTTPPLYQDGDDFVAEEDGRIVGFVATQAQRAGYVQWRGGNIVVLLVAPEAQRRGIGRALLDHAVAHLQAAGMQEAQIGGRVPRLWPGIADNLSNVKGFFEACGWEFQGRSFDLVRSLPDFVSPPGALERMTDQGITLEPAGAADMAELLAWEEREFSGWANEYHAAATLGDYADCLIARDHGGPIIGALLMYGPQSHPHRQDIVWKSLLGDNAGALNAVGVDPTARGRGIGLALVARGAQILKERGVGNCHIGWLVLVEFYGKLGYKEWHAYDMTRRALQQGEETDNG
jgi:beta-N-acetylhexosaminidase